MNEIATNIALALVVLFLVGAAGLLIWRAAMAKLELRVPSRRIRPGEAVDVTLRIRARRPLRWQRIVLSLYCRDTQDDGDARPFKVYREDIVVTGAGGLSAGAIAEYRATFVTPETLASDAIEMPLPESLDVLAPLADAANRLRARDFEWRVSAEVECEIVLSTNRRLDLTLAPTSRHGTSPSGQNGK